MKIRTDTPYMSDKFAEEYIAGHRIKEHRIFLSHEECVCVASALIAVYNTINVQSDYDAKTKLSISHVVRMLGYTC